MECSSRLFFLDGPASGFWFEGAKLTNLLVEDDQLGGELLQAMELGDFHWALRKAAGLGKLSLTVLPLALRVRRN